jgi:type III pantothenate kinase
MVASAVAATAEYPVPLIVVDLSTATTVFAVDEKRQFVGSVIAPGVALSVGALAEACDQLPRITVEAPREVLGKNTVDSMKSGVVFGAAALVEGLVSRVEDQLGTACTVVATGAYGSLVVPHCRREIPVDPLLLLKGLRRIYEKNQRVKL